MLEILADTVYCGNYGFNASLPNAVSLVVTLIKIFVPIILIIFGMLDLAKAVMSNDEKEMKGAQSKFIKRCIYAVLVFFIVALVQFIFKALDTDEDASITSCINCFISGECSNAPANSSGLRQ